MPSPRDLTGMIFQRQQREAAQAAGQERPHTSRSRRDITGQVFEAQARAHRAKLKREQEAAEAERLDMLANAIPDEALIVPDGHLGETYLMPGDEGYDLPLHRPAPKPAPVVPSGLQSQIVYDHPETRTKAPPMSKLGPARWADIKPDEEVT